MEKQAKASQSSSANRRCCHIVSQVALLRRGCTLVIASRRQRSHKMAPASNAKLADALGRLPIGQRRPP